MELGNPDESGGVILALSFLGSELYVGGYGSGPRGVVYRWDGQQWFAVGSTTQGGDVLELAVSGTDLYAGGLFTNISGTPANYIARWDGTNWSALGLGVNAPVRSLAISGSELFVGGDFSKAGGKVSGFAARAYLNLPTLAIHRSAENVTVSWPSSFGRFVLQHNSNLANRSNWTDANYPLATNGLTKSASPTVAPGNQFFRLIEGR